MENETLFQQCYADLHNYCVEMELEETIRKVDKYFHKMEIEEEIENAFQILESPMQSKFSVDEIFTVFESMDFKEEREYEDFCNLVDGVY